jgi:methylmalonyl-CoA mutase cobalamin-binding subunit
MCIDKENGLKREYRYIIFSSRTSNFTSLISEIKKEEENMSPPPLHSQTNMIVICGGVLPKNDYQFLYDAG